MTSFLLRIVVLGALMTGSTLFFLHPAACAQEKQASQNTSTQQAPRLGAQIGWGLLGGTLGAMGSWVLLGVPTLLLCPNDEDLDFDGGDCAKASLVLGNLLNPLAIPLGTSLAVYHAANDLGGQGSWLPTGAGAFVGGLPGTAMMVGSFWTAFDSEARLPLVIGSMLLMLGGSVTGAIIGYELSHDAAVKRRQARPSQRQAQESFSWLPTLAPTADLRGVMAGIIVIH